MRFHFAKILLLSIGITLGLAKSTKAQDTLTGIVTGTVVDSRTNTALSGVTIVLLNVANGRSREARTAATGEYVVGQLEPGGYTLRAEKVGYTVAERTIIFVPLNYPKLVVPVFKLRPIVVASQQASRDLRTNVRLAALGGRTPAQAAPAGPIIEPGQTALVSLQDWALRYNFDSSIISAVPLRGGRTFDQLALLAPGVARAPFSSGDGPAAGVGVGSVGQFAVHGLRSRSNNFTVDGSDNNDEDINVRRQGFVALVPQNTESVAEFQIMTAGFPAEFGRNSGSMVNAISQSGQNAPYGTVYGFFNHDALNARNTFDTKFRDDVNTGSLNGGRYSGKDSINTQLGTALGGSIVRNRMFYFVSGERQRGHGTALHHFVVPTPGERGLRVNPSVSNGFVPIGQLRQFLADNDIRYSSDAGESVLSLYPLPNNPAGPFRGNNYSQAEPFEANSNAFSTKLDWYAAADHAFSGRYNFTQDHSLIPFTGDAINSAIGAATRIQNLSLFANSSKPFWGNALRISYGRTRLSFPPSEGKPLLFGSSSIGVAPELIRAVHTRYGDFGPFGVTGPIGQLSVLPYSTIGVDVYNFPQGRVDNTFQVSDFVTLVRPEHIARLGFDIRYSQLNSFSDRNSRPLVVFGPGTVSDVCALNPFCFFATSDSRLNGTDLAALGAPSGVLQSLSTEPSADTTIGLRLTQYEFFARDDWRLRPNFTLNLGLRYELQTAPHESQNRIENTFGLTPDQFGHLQPTGTIQNQQIIRAGNLAFDEALLALQEFVAGRPRIYDSDRNNFAPRIGFAWDPTNDGKTAIRAGFSIQFDANPGIFTSQSRNVFPTFVPVNLDLNFNPPAGTFINSPTFFSFVPTQALLIKPGTLNSYNLTGDEFATGLGTLFNQQLANPAGTLQGNGLAFTLPEKQLSTAYATHSVLSAERQFGKDWMLSAAYVGTRGKHLPRFTTPNGGLISSPLLISSGNLVTIRDLPPYGGRPQPELGAYTVMENTAGSSYHGMELSVLNRSGSSIQYRASWTWSHAIDDVSDVFDIRGGFALPEDSAHPETERASASFDARHRVTGFLTWNGWRNWRVAVTGELQTAQPYTVNTVEDRNGDGNLTDRPGIGRNSTRGSAIRTVDAAVTREFVTAKGMTLEGRIEVFNVFNHTSLGIPVRLTESPGFRTPFDTQVNARSTRLVVKLTF